jgi:hypothetical protein
MAALLTPAEPATLAELVERWKARARKAFADAEHEPNEMGRRLIEHGATCYANCAFELEQALGKRNR